MEGPKITYKCKVCGEKLTDFEQLRKHCPQDERFEDWIKPFELCHYTDGLFCKECRQKIIDKRIAEFDGDTKYTDEMICPHCGYEYSDSWELQSESDEIICDDCGNEFRYERIVTAEYITSKI